MKTDPTVTTNARTTLTTVNMDVQCYIASFLCPERLSALMQTCRCLHDTIQYSLCSRSGTFPLRELNQINSFHAFLRSDGGLPSRAPLIKSLWFGVPEYSFDFSEEYQPSARTNAIVDIVRLCKNLKRLRVDAGSCGMRPPLLFRAMLSKSPPPLEEFEVYVLGDTDVKLLTRLHRLPLRKLLLRSDPCEPPRKVLTHLQPLADRLEHLSVHWDIPVKTPFANVRTLEIRASWASASPRDVATAFPAVTTLIIPWSYNEVPAGCTCAHLCECKQALRARNHKQWPPLAWTALSSVFVTNVFDFYYLGFPRPVRHLSLPANSGIPANVFPAILAEAQPVTLEVRLGEADNFFSAPHRCTEVVCPSVRHFVLAIDASSQTVRRVLVSLIFPRTCCRE